jgi:uncharacterized protein YggE
MNWSIVSRVDFSFNRECQSMRVVTLIISLLVCQQLMAVPLQAAGTGDEQRSITVQAQGFVEAIPDTLLLRLSVKRTADSLQKARTAVDTIVAQVVSTALENGIEEQNIDSSGLSSWPEYQWRQEKRHHIGESVQREISLKVLKLDHYGSLMEQLSKLSLDRIHRPQLSHGNMESLRLQALRAALALGRMKAEVIAAEIGAELGLVRSVRELSDAAVPAPRMMMAEAASADGGHQPTFNLARQRINARVEMVFALINP